MPAYIVGKVHPYYVSNYVSRINFDVENVLLTPLASGNAAGMRGRVRTRGSGKSSVSTCMNEDGHEVFGDWLPAYLVVIEASRGLKAPRFSSAYLSSAGVLGDVRRSMWAVIEVKKLRCSEKPKSLLKV